MRTLSDVEISRIKILTENAIEFSLIEPTVNGLEKSILDATDPVRKYFKKRGLHNYETQKQGPENKILVPSSFLTEEKIVKSVASVYRPNTKKGDPRIWFRGLGDYSLGGDILGLIEFEKNLYVINLTRIDLQKLLSSNKGNPIKDLLITLSKISNEVSDELLFLLRKIALNPVPALLSADTAIGRTLEKLLGININSSKKPDYKGIEIKSYRDKRGNRKNLFAQVPDWQKSKFSSSAEILDNFGYERGNDFRLYCTVSAIVKNSQGLMLSLDKRVTQLIENSDKADIGEFVVWNLETLHSRLLEKHNETFWIAADTLVDDGKEYFQYKKVEHTRKPIASQFEILVGQGIITLDHLIKRTPDGKVVEKGPLFKIKPNSLDLLFPPSKTYSLLPSNL